MGAIKREGAGKAKHKALDAAYFSAGCGCAECRMRRLLKNPPAFKPRKLDPVDRAIIRVTAIRKLNER